MNISRTPGNMGLVSRSRSDVVCFPSAITGLHPPISMFLIRWTRMTSGFSSSRRAWEPSPILKSHKSSIGSIGPIRLVGGRIDKVLPVYGKIWRIPVSKAWRCAKLLPAEGPPFLKRFCRNFPIINATVSHHPRSDIESLKRSIACVGKCIKRSIQFLECASFSNL